MDSRMHWTMLYNSTNGNILVNKFNFKGDYHYGYYH